MVGSSVGPVPVLINLLLPFLAKLLSEPPHFYSYISISYRSYYISNSKVHRIVPNQLVQGIPNRTGGWLTRFGNTKRFLSIKIKKKLY